MGMEYMEMVYDSSAYEAAVTAHPVMNVLYQNHNKKNLQEADLEQFDWDKLLTTGILVRVGDQAPTVDQDVGSGVTQTSGDNSGKDVTNNSSEHTIPGGWKKRSELGPIYRENAAFRDEFHKVITEMLTVSEFKNGWSMLVKKYGLKKHPFMVKSYDKRKKWAKCYSKGKFCAGMASTQRSESANNMLKKVVPRNSSMNRFVENLNKLLYTRYAEEQTAEHDTKQNVRVTKRVWPVERHAMEIYISKVYEIFSKEMDKSYSYVVSGDEGFGEFTVRHVRPDIVERYRRSEFKVNSVENGLQYHCDCGMYEHVGLLCCHVLRTLTFTMISLGYTENNRWTRHARDLIPSELRDHNYSARTDCDKLLQQSRLYGKALEVARIGNHDFGSYEIGMKHLHLALEEISKYIEDQQNGVPAQGRSNGIAIIDENQSNSESESMSANRFGASGSCAAMSGDEVMRIKAPPRPQTTGRPRTNRYLSLSDRIDMRKKYTKRNGDVKSTKITRHCRNFKKAGDDRRTCTVKKVNDTIDPIDEGYEEDSESE
ncbi:hypothetical protein C2845_PM09G08740 [Panicum miliaceum]|uniref:Protein FAR1-RELATED SEQUENCE n=1 Tax=Panicum miliaceum TaxID=4540 RepID=A0A3L6RWQ5_PANMI|nr:hypothetical protein C2845_PM09G08740 [Panicum miliaceum]